MNTEIKHKIAKFIEGHLTITSPQGEIDLENLFQETMDGPFCGRLSGSSQFFLRNRKVASIPDFHADLHYITGDFLEKDLIEYSISSGIYREFRHY